MKNLFLSGIITALITPFDKNKVDLEGFELLIEKQLKSDVNGLVLYGTTGEGVSLNLHEKKIMFLTAKRLTKGKIPLIACISSPVTQKAVNMAKSYENWGFDCLLITTPFYYKTTETGIFKHFSVIAKSTNLPIIIYNVPARTCCDISTNPTLLKKLAEIKNIVGIKHAGLSVKNSINLTNITNLPLFSGNDSYLNELLKYGYEGAISVISNIFPSECNKLFDLYQNKDYENGEIIFNKILPVIKALDILPNPISVKYAYQIIHNRSGELRLPLVEADEESKKIIENSLRRINEITFN